MNPPHSTGRNVIAILAVPIVMLFLIVITPFSLGIASPFDLRGMVDAGSRASLAFLYLSRRVLRRWNSHRNLAVKVATARSDRRTASLFLP